MTKSTLVAPCGMNCGIYIGYLREKNKCAGCRSDSGSWNRNCTIANCVHLKGKFCFSCEKFPCKRLKHLDQRYRKNYSTSLIENLLSIEKEGIRTFVSNENTKWRCPNCGGTISIHREYCLTCGKE